jgi:hypothetical protein
MDPVRSSEYIPEENNVDNKTKMSGASNGVEWFRAHPYVSAIGAAGAFVLLGAFVVQSRASVSPSGSRPVTWGGTGALVGGSTTQNGPRQNSEDIMGQVQNAAPYTYITIPSSPNTAADASADMSFDFDAFVALLSAGGKSAGSNSSAGGAPQTSAYAFIPGGLVSTTTVKSRTALQKTLFDYGNEVGSFIASFEQQYPNETQILINQAQDRGNADKAAAVVSLGQELSALGDSLSAMDNVPGQMQSAHAALAKSYNEIGGKLALVAKANGDAHFLAAIQSYNASVDVFTKNYVAMANIFVAYGVTFSPGDPGEVFTFTNASF